ncbi:MAG TPA: ABC transporter permease subunit [Dehalococcoidia bacterium]|nr:ABC transporter permease subunit [Dehalococcoidia bacterium]
MPGAGRFLYEATVRRDYNVVQASLLGVAVFVTLANLLVDIAYAWVDPRIRYK